MAEKKHIQHLRSKVVENGKPKLPASDALMFGEIAVNYGKGVETLSIKNESGDVVTFSSDNALAFTKLTNPSDSSKVGLVNGLSQYYDTNIGKGAVIEGDGISSSFIIKANGSSSHAEGNSTMAIGDYSHAEGLNTSASGGSSHAEGNSTKAIGNYSHAEGQSTTANGNYSHAEGQSTTANGNYSHAEGQSTKAIGDYSHAEGYGTQASGSSSHAEGQSTITNNESEHASGKYNVSSKASTSFGDSGNTLFSVGNGQAYNSRHNAFEIRQNGDIYIVKDNNDVKLQEFLRKTWIGTQTEYENLSPKDNETIYLIKEE